jgi:hypothetical protein
MPFTCCPKKETPEMGSGTDTTRRPKTQVFASVSTITKVSFPERVFAPAAATWAQADLVLGQGVVQGVVQDLLVDGAHGLDGVVVIAVCDLEGFPVLEAADDGHVVEVDFHLRKEAALNSGCSAWRKSGLSISVRSWAMSGPLSDSVLGFVESDNKKGTASWNKQTVLVVLVWSLVAVVLSMWLHKAWSTRERRERWPEKGRSGPSHEREGRVHGRGSTREKAPGLPSERRSVREKAPDLPSERRSGPSYERRSGPAYEKRSDPPHESLEKIGSRSGPHERRPSSATPSVLVTFTACQTRRNGLGIVRGR